MTLNDLYAGPAAGFDSPMEMLDACHGRVRRTLDLMARLEAHLAEQGTTDQARSAAADILRYFDIAGPAHHEDEERHVLPRLQASADPALQALAQRIQTDHLAMHEDWHLLRESLMAIQDGQHIEWPTALAHRYIDRYAAHLTAEEQIAFPFAQQHLSPTDAAAMGADMAARRRIPR